MILNHKFTESLSNELDYLADLLQKTQRLLTIPVPGSLQIQRKKNQVYYRISTRETSAGKKDQGVSRITKFISKDDPLLPGYIHVYCAKKMLPVVEQCLSTLKNHAGSYDPSPIKKLSEQFEKDFGMMTPRLYWSNTLWVQKWQAASYRTNTREAENNYTFKTARGEMVRSKNECIAADILYHSSVPYKYEYPVRKADGHDVFVDFKILNPVTMKEWYIEIFGKMDDPEYARKNLQRMNELSEVGITLGGNLLIAFDYPGVPFSTDSFRAMLEKAVLKCD